MSSTPNPPPATTTTTTTPPSGQLPEATVTPLVQPQDGRWSFEENKVFENALAVVNPNSTSFFEDLARIMPWKTLCDIKAHYDALIKDLKAIESGNYGCPIYYHVDDADYDADESGEEDDDQDGDTDLEN